MRVEASPSKQLRIVPSPAFSFPLTNRPGYEFPGLRITSPETHSRPGQPDSPPSGPESTGKGPEKSGKIRKNPENSAPEQPDGCSGVDFVARADRYGP